MATPPKNRLIADRRYANSETEDKKAKATPKAKPSRKTKSKSSTSRKRGRKSSSGHILIRLAAWIIGGIWGLFWRLGVIAICILAGLVGYYWTTLPDYQTLLDGRARGSVTLLDRNGEVFARRGDQFGGAVSAQSVSAGLRNAVIATEDKRFYRHLGISPRGIASAIRINRREGRGALQGHGGSTITQQTAKLLCLGIAYDAQIWETEADYVRDCRRTSLQRKAKEAVYALALEAKYSKDQILSIYLNRAYFGGGAYGAEAAAQRFFAKSAREVTAAEGAMMAGVLTRPSSLSPTANLERSQARAATVLRLMGEQNYLEPDQVTYWQENPASLAPEARNSSGSFFADWVMSSGPEAFTGQTTEDVIIRTTLDRNMQTAAEAALRHVFETKVRADSVAEAAIVVMSSDGAVRAMVGGRDSGQVGAFNRATHAKRQTGSAFKPFVYATALDLGFEPYDTVQDTPLTINVPGSGPYRPSNYTDEFLGPVSVVRAFRDSLNIPAVRISERVGRDKVRLVASQFGIESDLAIGPALALGASESSLLEMTGAYAGILNGGSSVLPYGLVELRIRGDSEALMYAAGGMGERVIQERAARRLVWMMQQTVEKGTGTRARFDGRQIAGKTGTTQAARDAWFIGFTADYVAGVWMGNDDNKPLRGVTGGGLPADIWRETMVRIHRDIPKRALPMDVPPRPEPVIIAPPPEPSPAPQRRPGGERNVIEELLRGIFGGN